MDQRWTISVRTCMGPRVRLPAVGQAFQPDSFSSARQAGKPDLQGRQAFQPELQEGGLPAQLWAEEDEVSPVSGGRSEAGPSRPRVVRTGSLPAAVRSNTLSSFSLSNIISSRLSPVRSKRVVSSM